MTYHALLGTFLAAIALLTCTTTVLGAPDPKVIPNVSYGSDPAQKMDVYVPTGFSGPRPGVTLIHGGGWQAGDKGFYFDLGVALARLGLVAFSVNYRLTPSAHYPAQVDDVQRAVRWMRAHAADYQFDPTRLGALGDSAGAHLSLFLGTHETRDNSDKRLAAQSSRVQCVVDFYGPSDLTTLVPVTPKTDGEKAVALMLHDFFDGTPQQKGAIAHEASPIFAVDGKSAPTLILTGTADTLVPVDQSTRMADALQAAHVEVTLAIMYKEEHGFLHPENPGTDTAMAIDWLTRHLKP